MFLSFHEHIDLLVPASDSEHKTRDEKWLLPPTAVFRLENHQSDQYRTQSLTTEIAHP